MLKKIFVLPLLTVITISLLILITRNTSYDQNLHKHHAGHRAIIAIGILSGSKNFCLREAQRKLFVAQARAYNSLDIHVLFLIDHPTPELERERKIHNDILYLNVSEHGWNNRFGKKLHTWYKYAVTVFPNATLIGRMDDDVFVCMPQIFDRLNQVKGW